MDTAIEVAEEETVTMEVGATKGGSGEPGRAAADTPGLGTGTLGRTTDRGEDGDVEGARGDATQHI